MMAIGRMIKHKAGDCIYILMARSMMVIGMMINSMEMDLRNGLMEQRIKEIINMAKKKEKVIFCGLMNRVTKDNLLIIIYMVMGRISGQMEGNTQDPG